MNRGGLCVELLTLTKLLVTHNRARMLPKLMLVAPGPRVTIWRLSVQYCELGVTGSHSPESSRLPLTFPLSTMRLPSFTSNVVFVLDPSSARKVEPLVRPNDDKCESQKYSRTHLGLLRWSDGRDCLGRDSPALQVGPVGFTGECVHLHIRSFAEFKTCATGRSCTAKVSVFRCTLSNRQSCTMSGRTARPRERRLSPL